MFPFRRVHTTAEVIKMEEMNREPNDRMERFRLFLRNNGFYIALVVCLIVIGGAILMLALQKPEEEEAEAPASEPIVIVGQSEDEHLNEVVLAPTIRPLAPARTAVPASTSR